MYGYNPDIPGDKERKEQEMMECYERVLNDLTVAGLLTHSVSCTICSVNRNATPPSG